MQDAKCPCKGCEDRREGCHGKCAEYKEWTVKHEAYTKARYAQTHGLSDIIGMGENLRKIHRDKVRKTANKRNKKFED